MKQINIWTDGGSRNHGNVKGGHVKSTDSSAWAFLIQYPNGVSLHRSGFTKGATNNQMELQGVISALATITNNGVCKVKSPRIVVIVDSKYVYNAFTKGWIQKWQQKRFHKVKNAKHWKLLLFFITKIADVRFKWVKGHAHSKGNIFVDHLLNKRMDIEEKLIKTKKANKNKSKE